MEDNTFFFAVYTVRHAYARQGISVGVMTVTNVPTWQESHLTDVWSLYVEYLCVSLWYSAPFCAITNLSHTAFQAFPVGLMLCSQGLSLSLSLSLFLSLSHTHTHTHITHIHVLWWLQREVSCLWRVGFLVSVQKCVTRDMHGLLEAGILSLMGPAAVGTTWGYGRRDGWMGEDWGREGVTERRGSVSSTMRW